MNHPLEIDGVRHSPQCAVWRTPAFTVIRPPCNCGGQSMSDEMPRIERIARDLAKWHGQRMLYRMPGGPMITVAMHRLDTTSGFARVVDEYADRHWREYIATAEYVAASIEDAARDAYNEGFSEGMKEHTSHRGGNPWQDSKARKKYVKEEAPHEESWRHLP